jgi:hypothetical protein
VVEKASTSWLSTTALQIHPKRHQKPVFKVRDKVRLRGKPDKSRQVLYVIWHLHCHDFVYVVESFTRRKPTRKPYRPSSIVPYWFASQLISEEEWQNKQERAAE